MAENILLQAKFFFFLFTFVMVIVVCKKHTSVTFSQFCRGVLFLDATFYGRALFMGALYDFKL